MTGEVEGGGHVSLSSRRNFLYAGGAAAAGAAALTMAGGRVSAAPNAAGPTVVLPEEDVLVPEGEDHLMVYVSNTSAGEVIVMTDGHEVSFHDPQLVARVQRAAKKASA